MTFNNILYPTDGSKTAKKAFAKVCEMAEKFKANVILLHVYELPAVIGGYEITPATLTELDRGLHEHGENVLKEAKEELDKLSISSRSLLLKGDAAHIIEDTIKNENIDLVVMGRRGLGVFKGFLMGSVSNHVIHHTKVPILLVSPENQE